MSIKLTIGAVEVTCNTAEEAMTIASTVNNFKPLKPADINKLLDQPITLTINGVEMKCENPASAAATLITAGIVTRQKIYSRESRGAQGAGPAKAWQQAEEYARKHGMSTDEARRMIAKKKREIKARLSLGKITPEDRAFMEQLKALSTSEDMESEIKKKRK